MNIGVLASHEGTTLQSVLDACAKGRIAGRVTVVVSNNSGSGALRRARQAGVTAAHLSSTTHPDPGAMDSAIRNALGAAAVDLVLLAGYMKKLGPVTIDAFKGRILNTHPALLPKFGGQGMYGDRVFEAVIEAGEVESGVSIHLVDDAFDTGRVVRQCKVPVLPGDSSETLKARTRMREREFVVETLADIARGALVLDAGDHKHWMRLALTESRRALPACAPNPPVGCVIVADGQLLASGYTGPPGQPHAEAMALHSLSGPPNGATVYVTLEPCSFEGRTPSCAKALAASGVARVYVGIVDPDPRNQGRGIEILKAAGISVEVGVLEVEIGELLSPYLIRSS